MFVDEFPKLTPMYQNVLNNRKHWTHITSLSQLKPNLLGQQTMLRSPSYKVIRFNPNKGNFVCFPSNLN
jgi:hypothetical protein